ncbi:toll/interleukin-1 receptor domain-containing protein [Falsiroseomonas sp. HC035]|uniref:toll/interleukin-1 receptor domain-containing protein n=1 Tax=Falsiroseomonas sp. HC035 TaxID=3390999 RepID=UPI003D32387C
MAIKLFVSYAHKDEINWTLLKEELEPYIESGVLELWYDRRISPGDLWDDELRRNLAAADVIILMISKSWISSKYIAEVELTQSLSQQKRKRSCIIPVLIEDVSLDSIEGLSRLQFLPASDIRTKVTGERQWARKICAAIINAALKMNTLPPAVAFPVNFPFVFVVAVLIAVPYFFIERSDEFFGGAAIHTLGLLVPFFTRWFMQNYAHKNLWVNFINGSLAGGFGGMIAIVFLIIAGEQEKQKAAGIATDEPIAIAFFMILAGLSTICGMRISEMYLTTQNLHRLTEDATLLTLFFMSIVIYLGLMIRELMKFGLL